MALKKSFLGNTFFLLCGKILKCLLVNKMYGVTAIGKKTWKLTPQLETEYIYIYIYIYAFPPLPHSVSQTMGNILGKILSFLTWEKQSHKPHLYHKRKIILFLRKQKVPKNAVVTLNCYGKDCL